MEKIQNSGGGYVGSQTHCTKASSFPSFLLYAVLIFLVLCKQTGELCKEGMGSGLEGRSRGGLSKNGTFESPCFSPG